MRSLMDITQDITNVKELIDNSTDDSPAQDSGYLQLEELQEEYQEFTAEMESGQAVYII